MKRKNEYFDALFSGKSSLPKPLSCLFLLDVLCSYVKSEKFTGVMDRCLKCRHYERFMREMAEEEDEFFEEVERLRRGESHG